MLRTSLRIGRTLCMLSLASSVLAQETIQVALNLPLSGPFANIGDMYVDHAQLAIEAINARGGLLGGRKLEIVPLDNKNSPQEALLVLKQITDRAIPFMIQSGGSHIAVPLAAAVEKHNSRNPDQRLLFLDEPGDQDLSSEQCSFWTFTFSQNQEVKMEAITRFIARQPKIKRVYLINQDYVFGQQVRRFAREMLAKKRPDIEIVGDDLHPLGKVKDFAPYVAKIKNAKADAVITGNWGNDITLLVRAAAASKLKVPFYTYYGFGPGTPTAMGQAAIDRVRFLWRWSPDLPTQTDAQAREIARYHEYKRRFGLEYYSLHIMNLLEMLASAIEQAGSTDALKVAYALENMRFQGNFGEVWIRPDDHQLFEALYMIIFARVNGRDVMYNVENTGMGWHTEARFDTSEQLLPTLCHMQRPPRP
jgi:branched-chain amino acid transport system substrate-binding protein